MNSNARKSTTRSRTVLVIPAIGVLVFASACERIDQDSVAIADASSKLAAIAPGGRSLPNAAGEGQGSGDFNARVYRDVISSLREAASSEREATKAAASLLVAQAHTGLAQQSANRASLLEHRASDLVARVRRDLSAYAEAVDKADSLAGFDVSQQIADINAQMAQADRSRSEAQQAQGELRTRIDQLRSHADSLLSQVGQLRRDEYELREGALSVTAVEGEALIVRANEIRRDADAKENQASERLAQAEQLEPQIRELQLQIDQQQSLRQRLGVVAGELRTRSQRAGEQAEQARAVAGSIAQTMRTELGELLALRHGDLDPAMNEAVGAYESAVRSARSAGIGDARQRAGLVTGAAQQGLAHALLGQLEGVSDVMRLFEDLRRSGPGELPEPATDPASEVTRLTNAAAEAIDQAREAYSRAGARGDEAKAALESLDAKLNSLLAELRPESTSPAAPLEPDDAGDAQDAGI